MELQQNLDPVRDALRRRTSATEGTVDARRKPRRRLLEPGPTEGTAMDARVTSLKILAQSLIHQIELLERNASVKFDAQVEVRRFEAELIRSALIRTGGRQRRAARLLGMKVTTLNTKIRRYKITIDSNSLADDDVSEVDSLKLV
jgi:transcriptional regulator with GAF, ATPase, and Fis domain